MRRSLTAVAVPLAAALALTACSSDDGGDDAAAPETSAATTSAAAADTIVGVASATPALSTLVAAVQAADLVETLSAPGPYTVFAPTNEAFEALPAGVVDNLLLPCNKDALTKVLTYHVVAGEVLSTDITPGKVPSVEGTELTIATDDGVTVDDATVTTADVDASNGVVHVIDGVLVPADVDPAALKTSC